MAFRLDMRLHLWPSIRDQPVLSSNKANKATGYKENMHMSEATAKNVSLCSGTLPIMLAHKIRTNSIGHSRTKNSLIKCDSL